MEQDIVKYALRLFDKKITSIAMSSINGVNQIVIGHKDYDSKIPLSTYGVGMRRALSIIMCIMDAKDGIVLVDEIENGIHYSIVPKFWEVIFSLTKQYNCQLFATTHSREYMTSLVSG